ncbi:unnamed protein product [Sphenostylis stenocarpa]|uniref:ADF-H domain-containing protein n=1 Tax=Sphenostylis stenocarpa TaxID=92480 RepID=A0AA86SNY9_9FABA|nr:unnamed protein product [Sphenostylis stenocarpa]
MMCDVFDLRKIGLGSYAWANAASGMAVHDDCKLRFLELKAKRTHRFIVFKIEEQQKQVIVEKLGEQAQGYEDLLVAFLLTSAAMLFMVLNI